MEVSCCTHFFVSTEATFFCSPALGKNLLKGGQARGGFGGLCTKGMNSLRNHFPECRQAFPVIFTGLFTCLGFMVFSPSSPPPVVFKLSLPSPNEASQLCVLPKGRSIPFFSTMHLPLLFEAAFPLASSCNSDFRGGATSGLGLLRFLADPGSFFRHRQSQREYYSRQDRFPSDL